MKKGNHWMSKSDKREWKESVEWSIPTSEYNPQEVGYTKAEIDRYVQIYESLFGKRITDESSNQS